MQNKPRIGVFADKLSHHFLKEAIPNVDLFYLFESNPGFQKWLTSFLPPEKLLPYSFKKNNHYVNDYFDNKEKEGILYNSNLGDVIIKNDIDHFVLGLVSTKYIRDWALKNKITLISTDYDFQSRFENKIFFDNFLARNQLPKPKSSLFNCSNKSHLPFEGKVVIQKPFSHGTEKTFFVQSDQEIKNLVSRGDLELKENYLVREYIEGKTFSLTVFIAPGLIALSSAEIQCFSEPKFSLKNKFIGVQWMGNKLNRRLVESINSTFLKIGQLLYQKRYFGFANFDFIVSPKEKIYLIDCNPRLATSTTHLIKYPSLISDLPVGKIFMEYFFNKKLYSSKIKYFTYPSSSFEGSFLYICVFPEKFGKEIKIINNYQNGLYNLSDNQFSFVSPDPAEIGCSQKQLVFFSTAKAGEVYKETSVVASVISNYPLYTEQGEINKDGQKVLETFKF